MDLSPRTRLAAGILSICMFSVGLHPSRASEKVSFQGETLWPRATTMVITGTLSKPDGQGPFPAVVLLPSCGGPKTFEFAKFWPSYLNKLGYVTLNVDHFTPRKGRKCTKRFRINAKTIALDAYGALTYLAKLPYVDGNRVAVLGSSLGALAINWFSSLGKSTPGGLKFAAAVSLYPSNCTKVSPNARMIPTIIILGDKERGAETCRRLPPHPRLSVTILPGVHHGFDQPVAKPLKNGQLREDLVGNKRLYNKAATRKAQSLLEDFLSAKLTAGSVETDSKNTESPELPTVGGKDPYKAVSRRDTDGDGKVSRAEWEKSPAIFSKIDANGDGFLTPREFYDRWQSLRKDWRST